MQGDSGRTGASDLQEPVWQLYDTSERFLHPYRCAHLLGSPLEPHRGERRPRVSSEQVTR